MAVLHLHLITEGKPVQIIRCL